MTRPARHWNTTTKTILILCLVILLVLLVYCFRDVVPPLVIAFLLAFILCPVVDFLHHRLRLPRGLAAGIVVLILIAGLAGLIATPVAAASAIQEAVESTQDQITEIINEINGFLDSSPVYILGYPLDLRQYADEVSKVLQSFVASVAQGTLDIALGIVSGVLWLIFILMTTFYLLKDAERIIDQIDRLPTPAQREDFVRLRVQITEVWQAFLRGQLLLGVLIGVITGVACWAVGLPYAGVLGLLAGLLEVVPNFGPTIAAIPAILLALLRGSSYLPIDNFWFAVLVTVMYILIQQFENNLIVPRVMGYSLNLHPLLVLIAIVIGGSVGGILGMLLAAPVLGTLRVIGRYIFCRLQDRDPFEPQEQAPRAPGSYERVHKAILAWTQRRQETPKLEEEDPT